MRRLLFSFLLLANALALAVPSYSQGSCLNYQATLQNCTGPNNCNQNVPVLEPYYSPTVCLYEIQTPCCSTYIPSYAVGEACENGSSSCLDEATRALLNRPEILEFAFTHTLWLADCTGHVGPSARLLEPSAKLIDLKPRIRLSGIGG